MAKRSQLTPLPFTANTIREGRRTFTTFYSYYGQLKKLTCFCITVHLGNMYRRANTNGLKHNKGKQLYQKQQNMFMLLFQIMQLRFTQCITRLIQSNILLSKSYCNIHFSSFDVWLYTIAGKTEHSHGSNVGQTHYLIYSHLVKSLVL